MAWQLIGQLRYPVSPSMDVGLKYRYFRTSTLDFGDEDFDLSTQVEVAQLAGEPDLQLRRSAAAAAAGRGRSAAAAAGSGNADLPGRFGDPGDGRVPGSAAAAAAAAARSRARLRQQRLQADGEKDRPGHPRAGLFLFRRPSGGRASQPEWLADRGSPSR